MLLFENWSRGVFCTLPCALDDCLGLEGVENGAVKQPWTVWKWMDPADVAAFGGEPKGLRAYLKMGCSFGEVEPLDVPLLRRTVNWDLVVRPQCGYLHRGLDVRSCRVCEDGSGLPGVDLATLLELKQVLIGVSMPRESPSDNGFVREKAMKFRDLPTVRASRQMTRRR
jgi:hypothetical protein